MDTTLEQQIADAAKHAVADAVRASVTGYNSPLQKMVNDVVAEHSDLAIEAVVNEFSGK